MRIGIAVLDSCYGRGGGTDVFTRSLVEALVAFAPSAIEWVLLIRRETQAAWRQAAWPENVQFEVIESVAPPLSRCAQWGRRLKRRFYGDDQPLAGEIYEAHQIDALGLNVVYYPRNVINHLALETPTVLTCFDIQHEYYPQFFGADEMAWRRCAYPASLKKAQVVVAPTAFSAETLHESYHVPMQKMVQIGVGVPQVFKNCDADSAEKTRQKYQLPPQFLFFPANPWPHKNHANLMAAMRIYRDRYGEPPMLILTGRLHNERRDAVELAVAAGVADCVRDLGFVEMAELPALYHLATALVFPSLFEGFGIPMLEAMAAGCPIVGANATTIPEIAQDAALLFDPQNPSDIAAQLYTIVNDQPLRDHLIAAGTKRLEAYDWASIASAYMQLFESVGA